MSSGLIPLEDFENAIALLSVTKESNDVHAKTASVFSKPASEIGQRSVYSAPSNDVRTQYPPSLPLEIIYSIARLLFNASHREVPSWLLTLQSPSLRDQSNDASMQDSFRALLRLSSTCKSYRSLLAPLIWHSVTFRHPRHFGEFKQLMTRYRSISSPVTACSNSTAMKGFEWTQEFPLRLVKELHIVIPERYPGFNQTLLVGLLRDGMAHSLQHIVWEAEEVPAASTLKALLADDFYMPGDKTESSAAGLGSEVNVAEIVQWTRGSRDGESFPVKGDLAPVQAMNPSRSVAAATTTPGLRSISINCKCFWPGHALLGRLNSIRHLRMTEYDLFLLPPHLPALLENLQQPLLSLSLSTSKTSLFHSIPIINLGCFDHLQTLDLYPVTPEYPLPQAIHRSRKTLRSLRLVMDISANFANFDRFWKVLTGKNNKDIDDDSKIGEQDCMEALQVLHIDPMPQQNTAPSFVDFVNSCPQLTWVNGRRRDSFAPGMETINPDELTSALYF